MRSMKRSMSTVRSFLTSPARVIRVALPLLVLLAAGALAPAAAQAEGGMGPHGLMIGMTGSGKSQTLMSILLSLLTTHPADRLIVIYADFKGEAGADIFRTSSSTSPVGRSQTNPRHT